MLSPTTLIETPTFTRLIMGLIDDEAYAAFQRHLALRPLRGVLLQGGGGLRKVRLKLPGRGQSAGARVIYLSVPEAGRIYLLYVFTKGDEANLSRAGLAALQALALGIKRAAARDRVR